MGEQNGIKTMDDLWRKIAYISQESLTYGKLAHYIEKNYMQMMFMTASDVAKCTDVSQGSVSRFCISLGYRGYTDFLHSIQRLVKEKLTAPQRLHYTNNSDKEVIRILKAEYKNMDQLSAIIRQPEYQCLVSKLVRAEKIVLISARLSATLLSYTHYILNKIRNNVKFVTPQSLEWETIGCDDPKNVQILAMVFPRYSKLLLEKMNALKINQFQIAALTDSAASPARNFADPVISVPITSSSIFDIYSTPFLFLNLLLRDIAGQTKGLDKRLSAIEQMDMIHHVYNADQRSNKE
ncbi:MAG: MurR/RpiR family transcriptional regulator [Sporolactobacillus sp.]